MKIVIAINLTLSALFWWIFYQRYYQYRHLFGENGRYFDGETVLSDSNFVYAIPAIIFLLVAGILYLYTKKQK